ncbi:MAG TPA: YciI family protein [Thermoanaerobaculia bacterium]|jgi:hypothetical protein
MKLAGRIARFAAAAALLAVPLLRGQSATPSTAPTPLFAVVFRTGAKWDAGKPPADQAFFKEHSANLKRLRQEGTIALGARYADVGLIVVRAADEDAAKRLFQEDPSIAAGTFRMEVHPFAPFFKGCVE